MVGGLRRLQAPRELLRRQRAARGVARVGTTGEGLGLAIERTGNLWENPSELAISIWENPLFKNWKMTIEIVDIHGYTHCRHDVFNVFP